MNECASHYKGWIHSFFLNPLWRKYPDNSKEMEPLHVSSPFDLSPKIVLPVYRFTYSVQRSSCFTFSANKWMNVKSISSLTFSEVKTETLVQYSWIWSLWHSFFVLLKTFLLSLHFLLWVRVSLMIKSDMLAEERLGVIALLQRPRCRWTLTRCRLPQRL